MQRLRRLLARRSVRDAEQVFVVEGATLLGEALSADAPVECVFVAPGGEGAPEVELAARRGARVLALAPGVMERVAGTVTPQPVAAVVGMRTTDLADLGRDGPVVVCVDVRDPGNLGTVLRSAEAAGAAGVVCCDGTVDVFNPKSVRASAGAVFHVPVVIGGDAVSILTSLGDQGFTRLATVVDGATPYDEADLTGAVAFVLGNEAAGLPPGLPVDGTVAIPMEGRTESLNVGMACAVLCFEAARQRRSQPRGAVGG